MSLDKVARVLAAQQRILADLYQEAGRDADLSLLSGIASALALSQSAGGYVDTLVRDAEDKIDF